MSNELATPNAQTEHLTENELAAYENRGEVSLERIYSHTETCRPCRSQLEATERARQISRHLSYAVQAKAIVAASHFTPQQFADFAAGKMVGVKAEMISLHVEDCEQCAALLQEVQAERMLARHTVLEGMKGRVGTALRTLKDSIQQGLTWQGSLGLVSTAGFQPLPPTMARHRRTVRSEEIPLPDEMKPLFLITAATLNLQEPGDDDEAATLEFRMPKFSDREMQKSQTGLFEVTIIRRDAHGHEKGRIVGEGRAGKNWNLGNLHDHSEKQAEEWTTLLAWRPMPVEEG